jgi:uncharacterized protein
MNFRRILPFLLSLGMLAQGPQPRPVVRASGEATVTAKPDRAQIDIGVVTQSSKAEAAASQNASQTSAVLERVKSLVGGAGQIQTANYSLNPIYRYPPNASPIIEGYTANNTVQVTLDDLNLVGKLIDASTQAGSNNINSIHFTLKDDQAVRTQALQEAAQKAKANAQAIAQALGLRVVGVFSAETGESPIIRPVAPPMMMAKGSAAPTPVEAGAIDVQASVTVTLEVAQP